MAGRMNMPVEFEIARLKAGRSPKRDRTVALGSFLPDQFRKAHEKPFKALGKVGEIWPEIVPPSLVARTALKSLARSVLTVHVDSASSGYELERWLAEGGMDRLREHWRGAGAIRRVRLVVDSSLVNDVSRDDSDSPDTPRSR